MEKFMTSEEIAELLHVDPVTIRRLVNKGELSAYRIGADYRFAPSDLRDYLKRQRITAQAQSDSGSTSHIPFEQIAQLFGKITQSKQLNPVGPKDRFDRFTKRARNVLMLAQEEAMRFQHNYIGTEHLLLGILAEGEGIANKVLTSLGAEQEKVRRNVELIIGRGDRVVLGMVGLTPRSKRVIELAVDEARKLNHHFVGTEHLLLALIREGEGIASATLEQLGIQLEQVRAETLRIIKQNPQGLEEEEQSTSPSPEEAAALLAGGELTLNCPSCSSPCATSFHYCYNCGQALKQAEGADESEG
ncbi:helix-turn-helix domain-containing protein [Ktedonospora formicarum]|uniref:Clp R domain-containing protein n=1 Tax=Ktedonospora formicarum TaxID=2778364 RepID=A0A8J3I489_9CHLR|nr:helix-turn-helix domain-containing protein [Ktedonospora formicarum]GHO46643.1 hypothetical protein KSX_48060 [Ktedonospora formicarum]